MKKVYRGNLFFFIILVWGIFGGGFFLNSVCRELQIFDPKIRLFASHIISFFIPTMIYIVITKQKVKDVLKLNKLSLRQVVLVILLGFVCIPFSGVFGRISSIFFKNTIDVFIGEIANTPYLILLLLIAVMPAITEEVSLRGVVLSNYEEKGNLKCAIMGGILFGLFHLNAHQFIYTTALGVVLVYAVRVTGSLYSSMLIHFIVNGTSITMQKIQYNAMKVLGETEKVISNEVIVNGALIINIVLTIIVTGTVIYIILKKLEKISGVHRKYENSDRLIVKDRIINLPFIMSIIVYIVFMILFR
ncbi:MAG: lysostaphin resistance A-like protein [Clostridium sp.]|uniref:CPBP family intramembrane glutamic endopeptidase n=1 Tax=Clostridium sp. TaxID=1506 RepID=UPI003EE485B6